MLTARESKKKQSMTQIMGFRQKKFSVPDLLGSKLKHSEHASRAPPTRADPAQKHQYINDLQEKLRELDDEHTVDKKQASPRTSHQHNFSESNLEQQATVPLYASTNEEAQRSVEGAQSAEAQQQRGEYQKSAEHKSRSKHKLSNFLSNRSSNHNKHQSAQVEMYGMNKFFSSPYKSPASTHYQTSISSLNSPRNLENMTLDMINKRLFKDPSFRLAHQRSTNLSDKSTHFQTAKAPKKNESTDRLAAHTRNSKDFIL